MLAGLHTLLALSKEVVFAGEALVVVLPNAGLAGRVAGFTSLLCLVLVVARGASVHAGAICTNKHTHTHTITQLHKQVTDA